MCAVDRTVTLAGFCAAQRRDASADAARQKQRSVCGEAGAGGRGFLVLRAAALTGEFGRAVLLVMRIRSKQGE